jgi:hypothetical protein
MVCKGRDLKKQFNFIGIKPHPMKKCLSMVVLVMLTGSMFLTSCRQGEKNVTSDTAVADTINMLMKQITQLSDQLNADSALSILSDDSNAVFISGGMHYSKKGIASAMKSIYKQLKSQSIEIIHSQVMLPAPGLAIWIAYARDKYITIDDKAGENYLCESWIWQRKPEGWRVIHSNESILDLPSPEKKSLVETALEKFAKEVSAMTVTPAGMFPLLTQYLKKYPDIYGAAMAFAPGEKDGVKVLASPYVYRKGAGFTEVNLESAYDYTADAWYAEPVKQEKPRWSDPYYDEGGGGVVMITYSIPLYDKDRKFLGVVTSDLEVK